MLIIQERNYSFEELEAELLKRLKERGCTPVTINGYRYQCHGIFAKLKENGYESYSNEGGMILLQEYYSRQGDNKYYRSIRTVIYRL